MNNNSIYVRFKNQQLNKVIVFSNNELLSLTILVQIQEVNMFLKKTVLEMFLGENQTNFVSKT